MLKNHPTLNFVIQRSAWYFLTFLVAITINFFLPRFGADPIELIMSKQKGATGKQAVEKRVSYMKEFGLAEAIDVAAAVNGDILLDPDAKPLTIATLEEKGLLKENEYKSFWSSAFTISDKEALAKSIKSLMKDNSIGEVDLASDESQTAYLEAMKKLPVESLKKLKGLKVKLATTVYTVDAKDLNGQFGGYVVPVESPYLVVDENGGMTTFLAKTKNNKLTYVKLEKTDESAKLSGTIDFVVYKNVKFKMASDLNTVRDTVVVIEKVENNGVVEEKELISTKEVVVATKVEPIRRPLIAQYFQYLTMVLRGDLGTSFVKYPKKVNTIVAEALPWTLVLQFPTIVLGWLVGNLLGALAAYKRGLFDKVLFPMALLTNSIPFFAVGMLLLYIFAEGLGWFPASGGYAIDVAPGFSFAFITSAAYYYILPFFSIFPVFASGQATGMRTMGIYELGTGYVKYAKTLGIKENKILMYIFRNAMLPQLTGLALMLGVMIGGALITEMIFSYPGLGMALLSAAQNFDYPLVQGAALLVTITVLIANFSVDLLIGFFDPRVKAGRTGA